MKIYEIINPSIMIEGMVEPNVMMSVQNIIKNGKATNTFEYIVVARLLQLLKNGDFYKESNPLEVNMSTSKDVLDTLRALDPLDMVTVAKQLLDLLISKDKDEFYYLVNPAQEFAEWLKLVRSREAND
jgi:hypothetical protein